MEKVALGRTGLQVSPLCVGTWQLAGPVTFEGEPDGHPDPGKEHALRLIRELGDRGINFIDTAEQYGDGEAERRTGEALKGRRDQWVISTKFGYRVGPGQTRVDDSSPPTILPSIEGSLRRLQTDSIDVYLYHCAPRIEVLPAAREILESARQAGKIRHFGISTGSPEMTRAVHEAGLLEVLQFPANLLEPASEMTEFCATHGIGTQVRGVLAQGRLSGKYFAKTPTWDRDDNRTRHLASEDLSRYAVLAESLPEGYSMSQAAIRWILEEEAHDSICLGAKSLADYATAIAALALPPLGEEFRKGWAAQAKTLSH